MYTRDDVLAEIRRIVIPTLREIGFKGSLPHLYRVNGGNHVDLLTFQFASGGGSLVVEIGFADQNRENVFFKKDTPAAKLRVSQTTSRRRLGAVEDGSDFWFAFNGERPFGMAGDPHFIADSIHTLIASEAIPWWKSKQMVE